MSDRSPLTISHSPMSLYNLLKFLVGFFLAIVILAGASVAAALYFAARLTELPERPTFENDTSPTAQTASTPPKPTTPKPTPTPPAAPKLPEGAYRAVVVQPIGLILRDSPSFEATRIGGVGYEEKVIVLEESEDKNWQRVQAEEDSNRVGWVKGGNTEALE
ncbi:SH3 domain-containing protein [Lyngbya aestuarii]|uniref:SH3 domain-containing protein n=1 Tax=Lyngbya aestuarii TaxID=118322 RepID=UPI000404FB87|nr:SH3 domain-containing protein [Lyngbya aestuarii]